MIANLIPDLPRMTPGQFGGLNGLRGLGALLVAMGHLAIVCDFAFLHGIDRGYIVVDAFFVFSGIVMVHAYGDRLDRPGAVVTFFIRRFGRLWPIHLATLGFLIALELLKWHFAALGLATSKAAPFSLASGNPASAILPNMLLLNANGLTGEETWNFPSWSVGAEFLTYILFVAVARRRWVVRPAIDLALALGAIAVLILAAPHGMRSTYDFGVFRCIAGFFTGAAAYRVFRMGYRTALPWPTAVELGVLIAVAVFAALAADTSLAFLAPFAMAILAFVFAEERGRVSRWLRHPVPQVLAEWSYSIYMVHAIILTLMESALRRLERPLGVAFFHPMAGAAFASSVNQTGEVIRFGTMPVQILFVMGYLAVVVATAALTYRYIETPGRAYFNSLTRRTAPRVQEAMTVEG